ncbi:MAG: tRNA (N6-threonylcarbamoyladenosine(37)-N6)-methyltransferase TrmO [Bacillota bacterium]
MILKPVGVIHSPYKTKAEAPNQGRKNENASRIEVYQEYSSCLKDIETATHLIVLYWADQADRTVQQTSTPYDDKPHGIFATRSPSRPNPINFSVVDLISREGNILIVKGLDALDGSGLVDLKPYSSEVDSIPDAKLGWRNGAS